LALPLDQRKNPRFASNALNSGNYLTFAIAEKKKSVGSACPNDLLRIHFHNGDPATGVVELRHYNRKDAELAVIGRNIPPIYVEPAVPFECVAASGFAFTGFTHMILAQSPQFTPATADRLLPHIRDYFLSS
jgi:hypothetical protein